MDWLALTPEPSCSVRLDDMGEPPLGMERQAVQSEPPAALPRVLRTRRDFREVAAACITRNATCPSHPQAPADRGFIGSGVGGQHGLEADASRETITGWSAPYLSAMMPPTDNRPSSAYVRNSLVSSLKLEKSAATSLLKPCRA
jgi:hypothetical protein